MSNLGKKMPYIPRKSRYRNSQRGRNACISHSPAKQEMINQCLALWPVPVKKSPRSMVYETGLFLLLRYLQFAETNGVPIDNDEWISFHISLFGDNYCKKRALSEVYDMSTQEYDGSGNA